MIGFRLVGAVFFFTSLAMLANISRAEPFLVSALEGSSNSAPVETLLKEAYARLDIDIEVQFFPARRSLHIANHGEADAELQRVDGLERVYQNLIKVPTSVGSFHAMAFTKGLNFPVEGWHSLSPYRIGIVGGVRFAELGTADMDAEAVGEIDTLFKMLDHGRFDVAVVSLHSGLDEIKRSGLKDIIMLEPIEAYPLFHYLHLNHAALVPKIDEQIRLLKAQGRFDEIWRPYLELKD